MFHNIIAQHCRTTKVAQQLCPHETNCCATKIAEFYWRPADVTYFISEKWNLQQYWLKGFKLCKKNVYIPTKHSMSMSSSVNVVHLISLISRLLVS